MKIEDKKMKENKNKVRDGRKIKKSERRQKKQR